MTSPTRAEDEEPTISPPPSHQTVEAYRPAGPSHHPHQGKGRARRIGGLVAVGLVVGYEVGAVALNAVLEEDVLPTLSDIIRDTSLRSIEVKGAQVVSQVGMWVGLLGMAVVVEIGLRHRLARRSRR